MRISDWSSDVCSSDLNQPFTAGRCDPPCPLRRRGKDASPRRDLPVRPAATVRRDAQTDDDHQSSRHEGRADGASCRSEEHTSELQSLMRISYAVFCLKKKKKQNTKTYDYTRSVI